MRLAGTQDHEPGVKKPYEEATVRGEVARAPAPVVFLLMPADCQVSDCGVLAIGRCGTCGRAFCGGHRGRSAGNFVLVDTCAVCASVATEAGRATERSLAESHERERELLRGAPAKLRPKRVPSEPLVQVLEERRKVLPGFRDIIRPQRRGWLLGDLTWRIAPRANFNREWYDELRLTALVDRDDHLHFRWVERGAHGLHLRAQWEASLPGPNLYEHRHTVRSAGSAIRRLLGESG